MITGTIEKLEQCTRDPYEGQSRYSPNSTRSEIYLKITLSDGSMRYYFNTPSATQCVTVAPGCAVVTHRIENGAAQWMKEIGDLAVAVPGKKNTNKIVSLVNEGDTVTIKGRLTIKESKHGNKYGKLTHVKRLQ